MQKFEIIEKNRLKEDFTIAIRRIKDDGLKINIQNMMKYTGLTKRDVIEHFDDIIKIEDALDY
jgi:histone acetyltransferase (RNA polymerase elongator complex component)